MGERKSGNCKGGRGFQGTGNAQKERYRVKEEAGWGKKQLSLHTEEANERVKKARKVVTVPEPGD